jgi:hypothetical protein
VSFDISIAMKIEKLELAQHARKAGLAFRASKYGLGSHKGPVRTDSTNIIFV